MTHKNIDPSITTLNPLNYPAVFSYPNRLAEPGAWVEHIPFAMFLVNLLRPRLFVELGTHSGNSYCAFCQAVRELGLDTKCFAVDTWQGDPHAGYYGAEVLDDLRKHHDPRYGSFSRLVQSTFDEAVSEFADGTIDLLHIDGLHTYEAVKHDYDTWFPKLSERAVVMFHDVNVREREFGVWQLWDELKQRHPAFDFLHGNGLGVLAVGADYPPALNALLHTEEQPLQVREFFHSLGSRLDRELTLQKLTSQVAELQAAIARYEEQAHLLIGQLTEREALVQTLNGQVQSLHAQAQALNGQVQSLHAQAQALNGQVQALNDELQRKNSLVQALNAQAAEQNRVLQSLTAEHAQAEQNLRTLIGELSLSQDEAAAYALSRSWRITRPLRKKLRYFKDLLASLRHWKTCRAVGASGLFDAHFYLKNYPDVRQADVDPLLHFVTNGGQEGRSPSAAFDAGVYLSMYSDVAGSRANPLLHYLRHGKQEGRFVQQVAGQRSNRQENPSESVNLADAWLDEDTLEIISNLNLSK